MAWRKSIYRDQAVWRSTRGIERDLVSMARRSDPARPLRRADAPPLPIVLRDPGGVRGISAVVQGVGMAEHGDTPKKEIKKYYEKDSTLAGFLLT